VKESNDSRTQYRGRLGNRALLLSVALFVAVTGLCAQESKLSSKKRMQIEKAVSKFMSAKSIPAVAVAVVLDGTLAWSQGFGMADLENYVPATSSTLFRLGSISKPITATAVMQLFERGKLNLDAEVQKYCPPEASKAPAQALHWRRSSVGVW